MSLSDFINGADMYHPMMLNEDLFHQAQYQHQQEEEHKEFSHSMHLPPNINLSLKKPSRNPDIHLQAFCSHG